MTQWVYLSLNDLYPAVKRIETAGWTLDPDLVGLGAIVAFNRRDPRFCQKALQVLREHDIPAIPGISITPKGATDCSYWERPLYWRVLTNWVSRLLDNTGLLAIDPEPYTPSNSYPEPMGGGHLRMATAMEPFVRMLCASGVRPLVLHGCKPSVTPATELVRRVPGAVMLDEDTYPGDPAALNRARDRANFFALYGLQHRYSPGFFYSRRQSMAKVLTVLHPWWCPDDVEVW